MDFEFVHLFRHAPDAVAEVMLDTGYQESLRDIGSLRSREILSQHAGPDGKVVRRLRCVVAVEISGVAKRFLGDGAPAWDEEAVWDPTAMRWEWVVIPEVASELLTARGTITLSGSASTTRTVAGSVRVRVPFYGGLVERWIVDGLERSYEEEAVRLGDWLSRAR